MRTACLILLCILAVGPASAQIEPVLMGVPAQTEAPAPGSSGGPVGIDIMGTLGRAVIAVPDFAAAPGQEALGRELASIIRYDLEFTGLFDLLPQERFPASFTGFTRDANQIDFQAWRDARAEFLVHAYVSQEDGKLTAECRLFDILASQFVVGKRLRADVASKRTLAHQFSDEIVLFITGEPGIATSEICFSCGATRDKEIYVADYDGANVRQATRHGEKATGKAISILPEFSPDGRRIAYLSFKDRYPFLYIFDRTTGVSSPLSKDVGLNVSPAWAPDGKRLAIVLSRDADAEIYVVNADGSGKQRLTDEDSMDTSPAFHPNGREIAFVSDRLGNPQIFAMNVDGSNVRRLSLQGGRSYNPEYSPDGKHIAYVVERRGEGVQVYVMDADGRNERQLTHSGGSNESPSWSADSRYIVFASTRGGGSELWTVNLKTGEERRVPHLPANCQGPSWGPRQLASTSRADVRGE